jgi:hypothetical protein
MAGGFGFDSKASVVREDTAKVIRELMGVAPDYVPPDRPHPAAAPGGRNAAASDD